MMIFALQPTVGLVFPLDPSLNHLENVIELNTYKAKVRLSMTCLLGPNTTEKSPQMAQEVATYAWRLFIKRLFDRLRVVKDYYTVVVSLCFQ